MNIFDANQAFTHGTVTYKKGGRFGPRRQKDLQLVYIFEGEALISVDGKISYLGPDEATLLLPGHQEIFLFSSTGITRHGWCAAVTPGLSIAIAAALEDLEFRYPVTKRLHELDRMIRALKKENSPTCKELIDSLIQSLFYEFLYKAGYNSGRQTTPLHPAVQRASNYIDTHFQETVDLKMISTHSGVTTAHLNRLFKEQQGKTAIDYLWYTRSKAAAALLAQTGLNVAEIAYKTGFANPAHFSRLFKQHYTLPPGQYRREMWNK